MTIFKTYWKIVKKNIGIIILYTVMLLVFGTMNLKANMLFSLSEPMQA